MSSTVQQTTVEIAVRRMTASQKIRLGEMVIRAGLAALDPAQLQAGLRDLAWKFAADPAYAEACRAAGERATPSDQSA